MNDNFSFPHINNNFIIIGLIFITCFLVIAILYFFKNNPNKKQHNKLIENFLSGGTATINSSSQYSSSSQPTEQLGKDNDKYNGEFKLRNCQVYFVGEDDEKACDALYNDDPLRTTCKYEFKDDWKEIDTISADNQTNTIAKKIYNKDYNNKVHIDNHNYMTACFKNIDSSDNNFKYKDNSFIIHKNIGTTNNKTDFNNTLRLHADGSVGNYISKVFNDSTNFLNNNTNLLDSICSIKYDTIPDLKTSYYKFKLIYINNEWLVDDLKDVVLNQDQTSFSGETPSTFSGNAAFGIYVNSYSNGIVRFSVFKSSNIPDINVQVYRFKYNYLCDGQILKYSNDINTSMKIKEIFDNTNTDELSPLTFDLAFPETPESRNFWTDINFKPTYTENKNALIREEFDKTLRKQYIDKAEAKYSTALLQQKVLANTTLKINSQNEKNTFHTKVNINGIDEGIIDKDPIIGLPTNNVANFNYTKGYNIVVTDKKTTQPVGSFGGAEPIVETEERMYPPIRNINKQNNSINGQAYGNGTYVVSYNNIYSGTSQPFHIFNDNNGSESGHWAIHRYRNGIGNGQYTQNDHIVPGYNGDWVKIKFPVAINLTRYGFKIRPGWLSRAPHNFKIYGSNNETTWVELTTGANISYVNDLYNTNVSTSNHYTSFALVVNKLTAIEGGSYVLNFDQWFIYGKELLQPTKIDDDYKYFSFKNKESTGSSLIYDFSPYNDLTSWSNYAKSLGGNVRANSFTASTGPWFNNDHVGHLEIPLPDGYNFVEVHYYNGHPGGNVYLLIGGVIVSGVGRSGSSKYFGSYQKGQILRIDERNTAIIGKNVIIKVSRSEDHHDSGGSSTYRFRIIGRRRNGHTVTQFSEIGFYDAKGQKIQPSSVGTSHPTHHHENANMSADNNVHKKYFGNGHGDIWLEYKFSSSFKLNYYDWHTANDHSERDPVHWVMEKVEQGNLVVIDEQNYRHNTNLVTHNRFSRVGPFHIKSTTTITSLQTITFPEETECDILIVGGGGSGGDSGGGAGQFKYLQNQKLNGQYTIKVGAGGIGSTGFRTQGRNGNTSSIASNLTNTSIVAYGGGGGAGYDTSRTPIYNVPVGSGGGGSFDARGTNFSIPNYTNLLNGFRGTVTNLGSYGTAGGGGGAGGNAPNIYFTNDSPDNNLSANLKIQIANGGIGLQSNITGTNKYYAGGGAGGVNTNNTRSNSSVTPTGGLGGGGNGSISHLGRGTPGEPNTGGGGGGCDPENSIGGLDGGSGIVIIRYRTTLSKEELIKRSSVPDPNAINYMSQGLTYFGNDANIRENTIWQRNKPPVTKIEANRLRTITIMSYMFLQRGTYKFITDLGLKDESIIYMDTMFAIEDSNPKNNNTKYTIKKNGQNNFTTNNIPDGGFYMFSYTCVILLNKEAVINFNIKDENTGTNIYDYLYGGLKLYTVHNKIKSNINNNKFVDILFKNNTQDSMRIISNYLDNSHDHYKTKQYTRIIEDTNHEISIKNAQKAVEIQKINDDFDKFLEELSSINYNDPKWFNYSPPTLKKNPSPSNIFKGYNEIDYVTYEKIENINDRTPTEIGKNRGINPRTNFETPQNTKRSIYILRP